MNFIENLRNRIDFYLRRRIRFSRRNYYVSPESKDGLFDDDVEACSCERYLYEKYNLEFLKSSTTRMNYLENLYTIELFDRYLFPEEKDKLEVLDIGAKNWFYAGGEYFFFRHFCRSLKLDGVEIDAYRLYTSLYSRYEVAKFYSRGIAGAEYIAGNLLDINREYDYIIWFLPFVLEYPLMKWGLPLDEFRPVELFEHAYSLLKNGGMMFVVNQDVEEYEAQQVIYRHAGVEYKLLGKIESCFLEYKYDRYASVVVRNLYSKFRQQFPNQRHTER